MKCRYMNDTTKECEAFENGNCQKCLYFKTEEQHEQSIARAYARLRSLPLMKQCYISVKYYDGAMPWKA